MADQTPMQTIPPPNSGQQLTPGSGISEQSFAGNITQMQFPPGIFSSMVKLDESNYPLWKGQVLAAVIAGGLEDFIFGKSLPPPLFLDDACMISNPDYKIWQRSDKMVMSLLFSALTADPLSQVIYCKTSAEVWEALRNRYESTSTTRIINLRNQMQQLRKDGRTMQQYLSSLKALSDQLSAVGEAVKYRDYIWFMLEGLPAEYDYVVTAVYSRADEPSVDEVQNLLLNFEMRLDRRQGLDSFIPQVQHSSLHSGNDRTLPMSQTLHPHPQPPQPHQIFPVPVPIKPLLSLRNPAYLADHHLDLIPNLFDLMHTLEALGNQNPSVKFAKSSDTLL
ncbi:hypothetical protein MLD38_039655 [Melastoma candidum]|uniref:Uncharacterized protein n=1 Tax=Melastoma candidum TaxID=119954 RepID=A0ACB9L2T4_9MYRT|nr:hypothetical protein MLD38_039655 [Melastoma candidum]